jgi:selenocysteine lyase/cysteine desulfurase
LTAIRAYERELCERLVSGLTEIPDLRVYGLTDPARFDWRVPTVSFTLGDLTAQQVSQRLAQANIFAWAGNFYALSVTERLGLEDRGGLLRVGLAHYSTAEEVDLLLGALADMPR